MGVHTLGRTDPANSGYNGWWSTPSEQGKFNNDFYISIIDKGWKKVKLSDTPLKTQWERSDIGTLPLSETDQMPEIMLNSDMCLAFDSASLLNAEDCCAWTWNGGNGNNPPPALPHCGSMAGAANDFGDDLDNCCVNAPGACVNPSNPQ